MIVEPVDEAAIHPHFHSSYPLSKLMDCTLSLVLLASSKIQNIAVDLDKVNPLIDKIIGQKRKENRRIVEDNINSSVKERWRNKV